MEKLVFISSGSPQVHYFALSNSSYVFIGDGKNLIAVAQELAGMKGTETVKNVVIGLPKRDLPEERALQIADIQRVKEILPGIKIAVVGACPERFGFQKEVAVEILALVTENYRLVAIPTGDLFLEKVPKEAEHFNKYQTIFVVSDFDSAPTSIKNASQYGTIFFWNAFLGKKTEDENIYSWDTFIGGKN